MVSHENCSGCDWFGTSYNCGVVTLVCLSPYPCIHNNKVSYTYGPSTKPYGYRTPEDRLDDIERRLDKLEGRNG